MRIALAVLVAAYAVGGVQAQPQKWYPGHYPSGGEIVPFTEPIRFLGLNYQPAYDNPRYSEQIADLGIRVILGTAYPEFGLTNIYYAYGQFGDYPEEFLIKDRDGSTLWPWGQPHGFPCLNNPLWLEHFREQTRVMLPVTARAGIFLDGVSIMLCDCVHCREAFAGWLAERFTQVELARMGVALADGRPDPDQLSAAERPHLPADPPEWMRYHENAAVFLHWFHTDLGRARARFTQETAIRFVVDLNHFAKELLPDALVTCNLWQPPGWNPSVMELATAGLDVWMYEIPQGLPPLGDNLMQYMWGFARSYRKPPAAIVGKGWALGGCKPWEILCAYGEATARGGEFLPNFGHPGGPLEDEEYPLNEPQNVEAFKAAISFLRDNSDLLVGFTPLAPIAIYDSLSSALWGGNQSAAIHERLRFAGLPYTVVAAEWDGQRLSRFPVLIAPGATHLSPAEADQLRRYVAAGGRLIFTGQPGVTDTLGHTVPLDVPSATYLEGTDQFSVPRLLGDLQVHHGLPARLVAPRGYRVHAAFWEKREGDSLLRTAHIVNYTHTLQEGSLPDQDAQWLSAGSLRPDGREFSLVPARSLRLEAEVPSGYDLVEARATSFERPGGLQCEVTLRGGRVTVRVPEVATYALVALKFQRQGAGAAPCPGGRRSDV